VTRTGVSHVVAVLVLCPRRELAAESPGFAARLALQADARAVETLTATNVITLFVMILPTQDSCLCSHFDGYACVLVWLPTTRRLK
jgi:hypothetical protein